MSRSTFYRASKTKESEEIELEKAVIHCFEKHKGNYGRIRIKKALERQGINVSENKISRILKEHGLKAKSGRSGHNSAPKPTEEQYIEENLIKDKFAIVVPNYLWCSDITEPVCKDSKIFTCGILDVATRRLVGWAIERHQRQEIVRTAFEMAVGRNPQRPEGAVYHSDRGCQYTTKKPKNWLRNTASERACPVPGSRATISLSRAFGERSNASRVLVEFFELYYNSDRLHSSIGYLTPNECFEKLTF